MEQYAYPPVEKVGVPKARWLGHENPLPFVRPPVSVWRSHSVGPFHSCKSIKRKITLFGLFDLK